MQRQMMADLQLKWLQATLNASTADWIIVAGYGAPCRALACPLSPLSVVAVLRKCPGTWKVKDSPWYMMVKSGDRQGGAKGCVVSQEDV
jgi:hypothetical protein